MIKPAKPTKPMTPQYILNVLVRRHWLIILPLCAALAVGMVLAVKLPRIYEAATLILIEPQRVPKDYVQAVVETNITSRISIISQQIKSRTNLEKIIEEFKLFTDAKYKRWFLEDKVAKLRKNIEVSVLEKRQRESPDAFSIKFQGEDPQKVTRITNSLATYFIDENLKAREASAIGTSDFLSDELETMRERLANMEEALKNYRKSNMGALPEQLETNLRILDRFQGQVMEKEQGLRETKNNLIALDKQISEVGKNDPETAAVAAPKPGLRTDVTKPNDLEGLKNHLESLQAKYTDQHPDIKRVKRLIADLEQKLETVQDPEGDKDVAPQAPSPKSKYLSLLNIRKEEIAKEIHLLETDIIRINGVIQSYEHRVEETPKKEQELLSLRRDYSNIKATYNSLLQRRLEAEIAVNMEKKQKGEKFRIIDPAKLPENPVKPDMQKLFLLTIAAGLALGGGLIFLLEVMDASFRQRKDIEAFLELPVMAMIPVLPKRSDPVLRLVKYSISISGIVVSLSMAALFFVMTQFGVEKTLMYARRYLNV